MPKARSKVVRYNIIGFKLPSVCAEQIGKNSGFASFAIHP